MQGQEERPAHVLEERGAKEDKDTVDDGRG